MTTTIVTDPPEPPPAPAPAPSPEPNPELLALAERAGAAITAAEAATSRVESLAQELTTLRAELETLAQRPEVDPALLQDLDARLSNLEEAAGAGDGQELVVPDVPLPTVEPPPSVEPPKKERGALHRLMFGGA